VAASTRCPPGGPVPRPRFTTAEARRWRPERRRRHPDAVPVATHTLPLSDPPAGNPDQRGTTQSTGTGSHRRPAERADCAMGSMSPPHSHHRKGLGPTGTGGADRSVGRVWATGRGRDRLVGRGVRADRFQTRHSGPQRNDHAVLQRPRRIHTGVALPGRSHVRVCRPALMPCLVHISGIRCLAVLPVLAEQCTPVTRTCPWSGRRPSTPGWRCAPHLRLPCSTLSDGSA
jgi:hypothetical protein